MEPNACVTGGAPVELSRFVCASYLCVGLCWTKPMIKIVLVQINRMEKLSSSSKTGDGKFIELQWKAAVPFVHIGMEVIK